MMPLLLLLGVVLVLWHLKWWVLGIIIIAVAWCMWRRVRKGMRERAELRAEYARALIERADAEHSFVMQGDERGVYGQAWPEVKRYREL